MYMRHAYYHVTSARAYLKTITLNLVFQDILKQLSNFVRGASDTNTNIDLDLATSALFLLQNLPASRQAVLQYLSNLFDEAVSTYIQRVTLFGDSNSHGECTVIFS